MHLRLYQRSTHGGDAPPLDMLYNVYKKPVNFPPHCSFVTCSEGTPRSFASLHAFIANTDAAYAALAAEPDAEDAAIRNAEHQRMIANYGPDGTGVRREFYYTNGQWAVVARQILGLHANPQHPRYGDQMCCRTSIVTSPVGIVTRVTTTPVDLSPPTETNPLDATREIELQSVSLYAAGGEEPSDYLSEVSTKLREVSALTDRLDDFVDTQGGGTTKRYDKVGILLNRARDSGPRVFLEKTGIDLPVTNAYLKLLEIFAIDGVIPDYARRENIVKAFFPAEAPGSSIFALQYALRAQSFKSSDVVLSMYYSWYANSLSTGGFKDKYGLIKNNPERWIQRLPTMAKTNGDIIASFEQITEKALDVSNDVPTRDPSAYGVQPPPFIELGYDIVMGDGSLGVELRDGALDYSHQSDYNLRIIVAEAAMVRILYIGGTMIVKANWLGSVDNPRITTLYAMLLVAFYESFDDTYLVKPRLSRKGNQEVYIVGTGYTHESPLFDVVRRATLDASIEVEMPDVPRSITDAVLAILDAQERALNRDWMFRLYKLPLIPGSAHAIEQARIRDAYDDESIANEMGLGDDALVEKIIDRIIAT